MAEGGAFDRLTGVLGRLPGIGRRTAERLAMHLVVSGEASLAELAQALEDVRRAVICCERCGYLTTRDVNPCRLCRSSGRDGETVCVVEWPGDIALLERSGGYRGRYHCLMGTLSPARGRGPETLRLAALCERTRREGFREVILALSTDVEGDATASYIVEMLKGADVRVSRLALGMPAGSGVVHADPVTLSRALGGRSQM